MYTDQTIICKDCGEEFIFTIREQEFYAQRGWENTPLRCKSCRGKRKRTDSQRANADLYEIVCVKCGEVTNVPFRPFQDRPVYCGDCYREIISRA